MFTLVLLLTAATPELVVQTGDRRWVDDAAISDDGKLLASISERNVRLWEVGTGKLVRVFGGLMNEPRSVALSANGDYMLVGGISGILKLWETRTAKEVDLFGNTYAETFETVWKVALCGDLAVIRTESGKTDVWSTRERRIISSVDGGKGSGLAMSGDCDTMITSPWGANTPYVWDTRSGTQRAALQWDGEPGSVSLSTNGKWAVTKGPDTLVWNVAKATIVRTLPKVHDKLRNAVITPDGSRVISGGDDGTIHIQEASTGKLLRTLKGHREPILSLTVTSDSRYVVSTSIDATVRLWETASGRFVRFFGVPSDIPNSQAIHPSGTRLFISTHRVVRQWDLLTGTVVGVYPGHHNYGVVALAPDGKTLATGDQAGVVRIWDARTAAVLKSWKLDGEGIAAIAYGDGGKRLVTGDRKSGLAVWEVATGRRILALDTFAKGALNLAVAPNGKLVTAGTTHDSNDAFVFDIMTGRQVARLKGHKEWPTGLCFTADSQGVWTGDGDGNVRLFELASGRQLAIINGDESGGYYHVEVSPDGRSVATSGWFSGDIRIYDNNGLFLRRLHGHSSNAGAVRFTPDGRRLVSIGSDSTARVWDAGSGAQIAALVAMGGPTDSVAVLPDGSYSATKGALPYVAFRMGQRAYGFEQFDLRLNRPDRVLGALGAPQPLVEAYAKARSKRLARLGITEANVSGELGVPEVTLASPRPPPSTTNKKLSLQVRVSDPKYALDRLVVLANDVPLFGAAGIGLRGEKSVEKAIEVELVAGKNRIQISALNDKGGESLRETVEIAYTGPTPKTNLVLVAIGVSKYNESKYDLTYAAKDARDLAALLQARKGVYGNVQVELITDHDATRQRILAAKAALQATNPDDHAIVFMAGHGLLDDNLDYYLATTDVSFAEPAKAGITYQQLEGLLDGIPARHKLLLVDACHSGELDKSDTVAVATVPTADGAVKSRGFKTVRKASALELHDTFTLLQSLFADLRRGSGAASISSASGTEYAYESPSWNNGVFTYSLLEGMKSASADANKDGAVMVSELRDYVTRRVLELTAGKQTPTSRRESIEFDFTAY